LLHGLAAEKIEIKQKGFPGKVFIKIALFPLKESVHYPKK